MRRTILNLLTLASVLLFFVALLWPALPVYRAAGSRGLAPYQTHHLGLLDAREHPAGPGFGAEVVYYPSAPLLFAVMGAACVLPLYRFFRHGQAAERRNLGKCLACGYDLRATPGRCPECGTEPAPGPPHNQPLQRTGDAVE